MNKKTLSIKMRENYGNILSKLSPAERAFAEKFEEMEYEIERGKADRAAAIAVELKGSTDLEAQVKASALVQERCNPALAEREQRRLVKDRKSDRKSPGTLYDPSDFIDQRFNASGYELAVSVSPEDAIVEALDAARAANVSLEDLLFGNVVITKQRGRGRPKKEVSN